MPLLLFLFLLLLSPPASSSRPDASLCPLSEYIDDNEETVREFFECPGLEDPPNYRACCEEKCCPVVDSVLQVRERERECAPILCYAQRPFRKAPSHHLMCTLACSNRPHKRKREKESFFPCISNATTVLKAGRELGQHLGCERHFHSVRTISELHACYCFHSPPPYSV